MTRKKSLYLKQRVDLSEGCDGESFLLLLHLESLEGDDLVGGLLPCTIHHPVRALLDAGGRRT